MRLPRCLLVQDDRWAQLPMGGAYASSPAGERLLRLARPGTVLGALSSGRRATVWTRANPGPLTPRSADRFAGCVLSVRLQGGGTRCRTGTVMGQAGRWAQTGPN